MNADQAVYLDSSALVKLVIREAESTALRQHLAARPRRVSCTLARVEVVRAVRQHGHGAVDLAARLLERIDLITLDDALLDAAAQLGSNRLRSLDAIHLAAARACGSDLGVVLTYDARMIEAAAALGFEVHTPR